MSLRHPLYRSNRAPPASVLHTEGVRQFELLNQSGIPVENDVTPKMFANSSPGLSFGNPGENATHNRRRNPERVASPLTNRKSRRNSFRVATKQMRALRSPGFQSQPWAEIRERLRCNLPRHRLILTYLSISPPFLQSRHTLLPSRPCAIRSRHVLSLIMLKSDPSFFQNLNRRPSSRGSIFLTSLDTPDLLNQEPLPLSYSQKTQNRHACDLATTLREQDCETLIVNGVGDHIHALFALSRTHSIAEVVKEIKRTSSGWVKELSPQLEKFYWQGGYGAFSVSQSNLEEVIRYIENQEEHHKRVTFQDEYRAFLKAYGITYDERYVWD
jgi:putative transposase